MPYCFVADEVEIADMPILFALSILDRLANNLQQCVNVFLNIREVNSGAKEFSQEIFKLDQGAFEPFDPSCESLTNRQLIFDLRQVSS